MVRFRALSSFSHTASIQSPGAKGVVSPPRGRDSYLGPRPAAASLFLPMSFVLGWTASISRWLEAWEIRGIIDREVKGQPRPEDAAKMSGMFQRAKNSPSSFTETENKIHLFIEGVGKGSLWSLEVLLELAEGKNMETQRRLTSEISLKNLVKSATDTERVKRTALGLARLLTWNRPWAGPALAEVAGKPGAVSSLVGEAEVDADKTGHQQTRWAVESRPFQGLIALIRLKGSDAVRDFDGEVWGRLMALASRPGADLLAKELREINFKRVSAEGFRGAHSVLLPLAEIGNNSALSLLCRIAEKDISFGMEPEFLWAGVAGRIGQMEMVSRDEEVEGVNAKRFRILLEIAARGLFNSERFTRLALARPLETVNRLGELAKTNVEGVRLLGSFMDYPQREGQSRRVGELRSAAHAKLSRLPIRGLKNALSKMYDWQQRDILEILRRAGHPEAAKELTRLRGRRGY